MNVTKIRKYKKSIIVGLFFFAILVNGGFFPIINFNPNNPVNLGTTMRLVIIFMAFAFAKSVGSLEAVVFSDWPIFFIGIFNGALTLSGLGCRYLLELGEVSNTYNFTVMNVIFQVLTVTLVSTFVCVLDKRKSLEER